MSGWTPEHPGILIARDFAKLDPAERSGYVIETDGTQFRYAFLEPGDPTDVGKWCDTESEAIAAAAIDWDESGSLYMYPTYLATLRREATKAAKREASNPKPTPTPEPAAVLSAEERLRQIQLYCENQGDKFRHHAQRILAMISD